LKEIYLLLFKKKQCPYCKSKIRRVIKKSFIGEGYVDSSFEREGLKEAPLDLYLAFHWIQEIRGGK